MLIDSPYIGDWMASVYSSLGDRIDYKLLLNADGTFERVVHQDGKNDQVDRGSWHHKEGDEVLTFKSDSPDEIKRISDTWWVLSVKTCEDSNCLMVLRWAALASRNLPILFYRVHLPDRPL